MWKDKHIFPRIKPGQVTIFYDTAMARQEGNQRFIGRIGDLVYYKRKGVYLVRKVGSPSKKRIKEDPKFDKTRKLNCEFGAAAKAGHDFRFALKDVIQNIADCDLTGRVQGLFAKVIHHGKGECGSRSIEILNNANELIDFQFNRKVSFNSMFFGDMKIIAKRNRKEATLSINAFDPQIHLGFISGATHLRFSFTLLYFTLLYFTLLVLSDYCIPEKGKVYKAINPKLNCKVIFITSEPVSLNEKCKEINLKAKVPVKARLPKSVGVIGIIGLEFFEEENKVMYSLRGKNCMKVGELF